MKINMFRIDEGIKYKELIESLKEEDFKLIKEKTINRIKYSVLINSKVRKNIEWINSLVKIFQIEDDLNDFGKIYNGILLITHSNGKIYGISFGHAFHQLFRHCDPNFALDFAESELKNDKIDTKSSIFIQNVKIKGLVNLKSDSLAMNEGGESYKFVSGIPVSENVFGKKVECGFSIRFSKNFILKNTKSLESLAILINNVEDTIKKKNKVNSFPRVRYISRRSSENDRLDDLLLKELKKVNVEFDINLSAFNIVGNKIFFNSNEYTYQIYVKGSKKSTSQMLQSLSHDCISAYINKNSKQIDRLDSIKIVFIRDGEDNVVKLLKEIIFVEIYEKNKRYILDSCLWGEFNKKFLDELNNQLEYITDNHMELNKKEFSIPYANEDDYINNLVKSKKNIQLHKKLIIVGESKLEVADLFITPTKELISVKLGKDNKDFIYSFDQAISSVKCMTNYEEYLLRDQLTNKGVNKKIVDSIMESNTNSVLLGLEQQSYKKLIKSEKFKLTDLKSLLLKLKIVAWAKYLTDANMNFKLHIIAGVKK